MKGKFVPLVLLVVLASCHCLNLNWEALPPPNGKHSRGLSVPGDSIVWISGFNGSVARSTNTGKTWDTFLLPGADSLDMRDIHAFDALNAVTLSAGSPALAFHTTDGGVRWKEVYRDTSPTIFYDGMDFWNRDEGIAFGDPINGRFATLRTTDGGASWNAIAGPEALETEGGFAASGTSICTSGESTVWIGSGMAGKARVFRSQNKGQSWEAFDTPIRAGEGCGIFSMTFWNEREGVIVGGCYGDSANSLKNCAITDDGGETWRLSSKQTPRGYRSCVASNLDGTLLISTGRSGTDYSLDKGITWSPLGNTGFYSVAIKDGLVWASGRNGRVSMIRL